MPAYLIAEHVIIDAGKFEEHRPLIALRQECTSDRDMLITLEGA